MKEMRQKVQDTIETLGESQDKLEEIAYEMLNLSDIIRNDSQEAKKEIEQLATVDSIKEKEIAIEDMIIHLDKVIKVTEQMSYFVHQNEEYYSIQRECIEEAKQMCDFIHCFLDNTI